MQYRFESIVLALLLGLAACTGESVDDTGMDLDEFDVPPVADELETFLERGDYQQFPAESGPRAPMVPSPHGQVRVFVNPTLDASLQAGNQSHPVGSASVKELYDAQGALTGWAVSVKTQADSAGGNGWYWYELLGGEVVVNANGAAACVGCHAGVGTDYFSTSYPLQ